MDEVPERVGKCRSQGDARLLVKFPSSHQPRPSPCLPSSTKQFTDAPPWLSPFKLPTDSALGRAFPQGPPLTLKAAGRDSSLGMEATDRSRLWESSLQSTGRISKNPASSC